MDVKLVIADGKHAGQEIKVTKDAFYIGKSPKCHLRPGGSQVGEIHCAILRREGYAGVKDLGTPFGTFVNGEKVEGERAFKNGDKLRVGGLTFEVQLSVGVSGEKKPKVNSIQEAANRVSQKKQSAPKSDAEIDIFAIFEEEVPTEEDLPSFISRKKHAGGQEDDQEKEETALDKEKKMQESTRNAAADTIKAILGQAIIKKQ